jgi:hypothetical protein
VIIEQFDMAITHIQAATSTPDEVPKMMEISNGGKEEQGAEEGIP